MDFEIHLLVGFSEKYSNTSTKEEYDFFPRQNLSDEWNISFLSPPLWAVLYDCNRLHSAKLTTFNQESEWKQPCHFSLLETVPEKNQRRTCQAINKTMEELKPALEIINICTERVHEGVLTSFPQIDVANCCWDFLWLMPALSLLWNPYIAEVKHNLLQVSELCKILYIYI